jgi:hypothetical protein
MGPACKNFFDFFDVAVKMLPNVAVSGTGKLHEVALAVISKARRADCNPKGGAMDGAVSIAIRHRRIDGVCTANPEGKKQHGCCFLPAQGIEAEIPEAPQGLRNWSG